MKFFKKLKKFFSTHNRETARPTANQNTTQQTDIISSSEDDNDISLKPKAYESSNSDNEECRNALVLTSSSDDEESRVVSKNQIKKIIDLKELVLENCEAMCKLYWIVDGDTMKFIVPILSSEIDNYFRTNKFMKFSQPDLNKDDYIWIKINVRLAGYGKNGGADAYEKETLLGQIAHLYTYGIFVNMDWIRIVFKGTRSTDKKLKCNKEPHGRSLGIIYASKNRTWDKVLCEECNFNLIKKTNDLLFEQIHYKLPHLEEARMKVLGIPYNGCGKKADVVKSTTMEKKAYNNLKRESNKLLQERCNRLL